LSFTAQSNSETNEQQMTNNLPTISASIKDDCYDVRIHGEQNLSFRSEENAS
jgi:hypothetical protein